MYLIFLWDFSFQFSLGAGSDGPIGSMAGMEPHHINGSLGKTDLTDITQWHIVARFKKKIIDSVSVEELDWSA